MRTALALLALLLAAWPAAGQEHGETRRYFGDWLAACRADGYCSATGYENPNPGGRVADYVFRVGRQPQPGPWELSFSTVVAIGDEDQPFTVSAGDLMETFSGSTEIAAYGSINDFFLLGPKAQAVFDAILPANTMAIGFTDTEGESRQAQFSLRGLTAALRWIDQRQAQIGSDRLTGEPPRALSPARQSEAPNQ